MKNIVWDSPSTLKITFPEIYLDWWHKAEIIESITKTMHEYEEDWVLENQWMWFIYIERQTAHVPIRKGLILALDLEKYDFSKGSQTLIRATEWTIIERIPPQIRESVAEEGIYLTGGTTRIPSIDKYLKRVIGCPINLSEYYEMCTIRGLSWLIKNKDLQKWAYTIGKKKWRRKE